MANAIEGMSRQQRSRSLVRALDTPSASPSCTAAVHRSQSDSSASGDGAGGHDGTCLARGGSGSGGGSGGGSNGGCGSGNVGGSSQGRVASNMSGGHSKSQGGGRGSCRRLGRIWCDGGVISSPAFDRCYVCPVALPLKLVSSRLDAAATATVASGVSSASEAAGVAGGGRAAPGAAARAPAGAPELLVLVLLTDLQGIVNPVGGHVQVKGTCLQCVLVTTRL